MQLNYVASVVFGVLAVVLLFAYAVLFRMPNLAGFAVWVAAAAWAACWFGAAGQYAVDEGHVFTASVMSFLSLASTAVAAMFFLFALTRIA